MKEKQIVAIREKIAKKLHVQEIFGDLSPELQTKLGRAAEYGDFRLIENERQLEAIKSMLGPYIFNENVVVRGIATDRKGDPKVVKLDHFEVMMKATNIFLNVMNMQNKMWGLYTSSPASDDGDKGKRQYNIKNLSINMVQELQRIAKRESLPIPTAKAEVIENGQ